MRQQVTQLQAANKAATRRRLHKRKQIQKEGTLTIKEGACLTALKEFRAYSNRKKGKKRARNNKGKPTQQRCRKCGNAGHNARTCKDR
jgi:ribosomal protein L32